MLTAISVISSSKGKDLVGVKSMTVFPSKKSSRLMCQCHATVLHQQFVLIYAFIQSDSHIVCLCFLPKEEL